MVSCSSVPYDIDQELEEAFETLNKSLDDLLNVDRLPGRGYNHSILCKFVVYLVFNQKLIVIIFLL